MPDSRSLIGRSVARFRIVEKLGGMGVVTKRKTASSTAS
jgi:hypothetical protein